MRIIVYGIEELLRRARLIWGNFFTGTAPGTPDSGEVRLYAKTDKRLYTKDDGGTERLLGSTDLAYTAEDVANKATAIALGTSNTLYPSQGAVKSYVDTGLGTKQNSLGFTAEDVANKATAIALGTSNTLYPSQGAVKSYVDTNDKVTNSTTETATKEVDTDDYTVYKKVIIGTFTASANATTNIAHGISTLRTMVAVQCLYRLGASTVTSAGIIQGHREGGGNWSRMQEYDGTNITYYGTYAWGTSAYRITLYYTKT